MTARQVAAILGVSLRTVETETDLGRLPCQRVRRSVRYTWACLDEYEARTRDDGSQRSQQLPPTYEHSRAAW
jgi:excisionase family DNA binding protein